MSLPAPILTLGDPRLAQAITDLVDRRVRAALGLEGGVRYGVVAAVGAGVVSVYLGGSPSASPGFVVPAYLLVQVGDQVRVVIRGADRYVDAVIPGTAFALVAHTHPAPAVPPLVIAQRTATQSIPGNAVTPVAMTAVDISDALGWHDPAVNPTRITVPTAGTYLVWGEGQMGAHAGVRNIIGIAKNGTLAEPWQQTYAISSGIAMSLNFGAALMEVTAGDILELAVYQSTAGAINFGPAQMGVLYVGPLA